MLLVSAMPHRTLKRLETWSRTSSQCTAARQWRQRAKDLRLHVRHWTGLAATGATAAAAGMMVWRQSPNCCTAYADSAVLVGGEDKEDIAKTGKTRT